MKHCNAAVHECKMVSTEAHSQSFKLTSACLSFIMLYQALHNPHCNAIIDTSCAAMQTLVRMCSATCSSPAPRSIQHTHYMQQLMILMAELLKQALHYLGSDRHQIQARHMAAFVKKVSKRQFDIRKLSAQLSRSCSVPNAVAVCHAVMLAVLSYALPAMPVHTACYMSLARLLGCSAPVY